MQNFTAAQLAGWQDFTPDRLRQRFEPARVRGAWSAIVDTLEMIFGLAPRQGIAGPPASLDALSPADSVLLAAQVDSLRQELRAGERDSAARLSGRITIKRFDPELRTMNPQRVRLFVGRPPGPLVIHDPAGTLPRAETRTVCWLALAAKDLATQYGGVAMASLAIELGKRAARWDNFMRRGYSMTPLELLVNGYMPRKELEPPRLQLVLGHVSAGQQMVTEGALAMANLRRRTVLVLEPIGLLGYSSGFDRYGGATWVLAYPDSGGVAAGIMLHHSNVGHVGWLWRPDPPPGSPAGALLLSLDLYRFLRDVPDQWKRLKDEAIAHCLADVTACAP